MVLTLVIIDNVEAQACLWRDVVTNWLSNKQDLTLFDLLWQLAQTNMIPATLIDNSNATVHFVDANHVRNIN